MNGRGRGRVATIPSTYTMNMPQPSRQLAQQPQQGVLPPTQHRRAQISGRGRGHMAPQSYQPQQMHGMQQAAHPQFAGMSQAMYSQNQPVPAGYQAVQGQQSQYAQRTGQYPQPNGNGVNQNTNG